MSLSTIGDMRQHFLSVRHNTQLKTRLGTLTQELATGEKADRVAHLGNDQSRLADMDRQIGLAQAYRRGAAQLGQALGMMQTALSRIETQRSAAADALLTITESSQLAQMEDASAESRRSFDETIRALNTRLGDQALFAGVDAGGNALADPDAMIADIVAALATATDAAGVLTGLDVWFDDPGGGFATMGYLGSTGAPLSRAIDAGQTVDVDARADSPATRDILKSLAMGALAADPALALSDADRAVLARTAGEGLMTSASGLTGLQAGVGFAEARVEDAQTHHAARISTMEILRNDLLRADPFETASALEQVQLQLETHYTLTARLSRLSLTEYLR